MSKKTEEDEENKVQNYYKKFQNQGPEYFGDLDEADGKLLQYEMHAEEEGTCVSAVQSCTSILRPFTPSPVSPSLDRDANKAL